MFVKKNISRTGRGIAFLSFFLLAGHSLVGSLLFGDESISVREYALLSECFKSMLETSEAGYVLCGQKPLCLIGHSQHEFSFEPREFHRLSISIGITKEMLQRPIFRSGNILFHFDEKSESFVVLNKKNFLNVLEDNKILFQYVLGPTITPERLLEAILSSEHSFFEIFKYDRVLIGIVLGYGVQNSLYQSRKENIFGDLIHAGDLPPFTPYTNLYPNESQTDDLLFYEKNFLTFWGKERRYLTPSYGYTSLQEELNDLKKKMQTSSPKLQQIPNFIFGCLKDSKENEVLLTELEKTQDKIKELLQSENLLQNVLELITKEKLIVDKDKIDRENHVVDITLALAKLFRLGLKEYPAHYLPYFIEGLQGQMSDLESFKEILAYPNALTNLQRVRTNLEEANLYFQKIKENQDYSALCDPYLYASIVEQGTGISLQGETDVLVDYEIFDPKGNKLNTAFHQRLDLKKVLPAFAYGVQGMKVGEIRQLFIHSSLAYGVHTLLEKGIYLTAVVKLHHIYDSVKQELPPMQPTDLSYILAQDFYTECEERYKRALKFAGKQKREFLQLCSGVDLDLVAKTFQSPAARSPLTREEMDAINCLFWNIYFSTNS
jgi:FKBP-type peptidyl-prolyl cis-trans isomerase